MRLAGCAALAGAAAAAGLPASDEFADPAVTAAGWKEVDGGLRDDGRPADDHWVYSRYDLPRTLQVGIDAFSGFEDTKADLVSHVDWFHLEPTGVPAKLKSEYLHGRVRLKRLLP